MKSKLNSPEVYSESVGNQEMVDLQAQKITDQLEAVAGEPVDVHIHVTPEVKSKGLFSVCLHTRVESEEIVVKKVGKRVDQILRKAGKASLRAIKKAIRKKYDRKRRSKSMNWVFQP